MDVFPLFPVCIGRSSLGRNFSREELGFIKTLDTLANIGNTCSVNSYVLKERPLYTLNDFLNKAINEFFREVYKPLDDVKIYITQSWVNFTSKKQFHHKHLHSNSYLSGVLYINTTSTDRIYFYKNNYSQIYFPTSDNTIFNITTKWFETKIGDLYIFPSYLEHSVEPVEHDETRISLSFNTFLKGTLGEKDKLTELIL